VKESLVFGRTADSRRCGGQHGHTIQRLLDQQFLSALPVAALTDGLISIQTAVQVWDS
jgi:hypothetical protein